ncbi:hypothetical protein HYALB_00003658 [Hymenoscyphus albidus]|uniref:SRP9 domain-containing protein n=1 Tax=Hymenoscyphus albidus TaxID=595503 RepID=A0A9N9LEH5_9HELO|nr:hypothetical protein HYALB_00003658 [Hymenoscyphus albidus]
MPTLETAQSWLQQSTLLLQARPSTTRITTKYTLPRHANPLSKSSTHPKPPKTTPSTPPTTATAPATTATATLTLKTYDPVSGTTLKYRTNKAAEVGRLIQILGRLARPMMVGLGEVKEDVKEEVKEDEGGETGGGVGVGVGGKEKGNANAGTGTGTGGVGKKGKKKGKK